MQLVISTLFLSILMKLLLIFVQKCTKETGILKVDSVSGKIVEKTGNSGYKIYITEDPKGDVKGVREWKRSLRICEAS